MSTRELLTREEIRAFTRTSNAWGALAIAWTWMVIVACAVVLARWPHPAVFAAVVVVLGGRQLALAVMMHEAAHGTLFRSKLANEVIADWLCARPVWSDVARYRKHHLGHHAHTGTDKDPDLGLAPLEPMTRGSLARKVLRDLTGVAGLRRVIALLLMDAELLRYNVGGGVTWQRFRPGALVRNTWKTVAINVAMAWVVGWIYLAWAVAYLTTFGLFLRIRMLAEHACTQRGADPLRNTRTTYANLIARATVAPLHVNYHLEHHLVPTAPWYRLPALHARLKQQLPERSIARGYGEVLRTVSAPSTPA